MSELTGNVCADCALLHINGEGDEQAATWYAEGMADLMADELSLLAIDTSEGPVFLNVARCMVCGQRWAGDYFPATGFFHN